MNFLSLFDDFILHMRTNRGVEAQIQVLIHESANMIGEHALARELTYERYNIVEAKRLPLLWGERELTLGGCSLTTRSQTGSW